MSAFLAHKIQVLSSRGSDKKSILFFHLAALKTMRIKTVYLCKEKKGKKKKGTSTLLEVQLANLNCCLCLLLGRI